MEKFTKLGLSKELTDILEHSGFKEPTEIQEKVIPLALAGKDIIGGSATGSGKTLAFASAIIENLEPNKGIQALILTPTRELAEQVATTIRNFSKNRGLNVLSVYGGVKIGPQIKKLFTTDVLVGTPGRILDHIGRKTLRLDNINFLILDEVDRMLDMGFSRDVEKIINKCPEKRQTMLFSATISENIAHLAQKYTKNLIEVSVESYVDPSKLKQIYYDVPDNKKFSLLVHLLKQEKNDFVLVFCNTRRNVDVVTNNLIRVGIKVKAIHGGLDQKKRLRILNEFKGEGKGVLVCTDIAARGLDIKNVSHVYNYDFPTESKDYIHRIGRTARAGKEGKAIILLASRDYENFGILTRSREFNINLEKLPWLEVIRLQIPPRKNRSRHSRGSWRKSSNRVPKGRWGEDSRGHVKNKPRKHDRNGPRRSSNKRIGNSRNFSRKKRYRF